MAANDEDTASVLVSRPVKKYKSLWALMALPAIWLAVIIGLIIWGWNDINAWGNTSIPEMKISDVLVLLLLASLIFRR